MVLAVASQKQRQVGLATVAAVSTTAINHKQSEMPKQQQPLAIKVPCQSNIVNFYQNRSVLITGGSGFIGKVLIEKLLRTCPDLRRIFVLIRPKWKKQPHERLQELLNGPLFDGVRGEQLDERVIVVEGDVTQTNLGLSEQNLLRIMNEVSVIYHSAATVKFDEPLKQSIAINIAGTKNMIELCRKIPQLAALVHVSTAYANCDRDEIDEYVYPIEMNPENLIEMAKWLDQDTLQELKTRLLGAKPNTYTYTKALGEWLLVQCGRDLPVVICRPSIVAASWREPFSGWIDNVNGPTGILLGTGKGLIRSMYAQSTCVADLIPVDTVINLIVTLGWFAHVYRNHKQSNETAESLTESLIGSASDDLLDEYSERLVASKVGEQSAVGFNGDENEEDDSIRIGGECYNGNNNKSYCAGSNNNNKNKKYNRNHVYRHNNNNNNSSSPEFHEAAFGVGAEMNAGVGFAIETATDVTSGDQSQANGGVEQQGTKLNCTQRRLHLDEGYVSTTQSPDKKLSESSTLSSSLSLNQPNETTADDENNDDDIKDDNNVVEILPSQESIRVLSFVAQRRLAEQKHADFEYKLKQFRHNTQVKLASKNLPEEIADVPVFHCTSGDVNPITWGRIQVLIMSILALYPSITTYRYPCGSFTNNKPLDDFYRITLHYLPGYIVDFFTRLCGGKPILVKIFKKFDQAANVLKAFTSRQWKFKSDNRLMLINELMSEEDKRLFNCDIKSLDWTNFLTDYVLGVRQFMLKEPISNLERARSNLKIVYYRNLSLQVLSVAIAYYFVTTLLNVILS